MSARRMLLEALLLGSRELRTATLSQEIPTTVVPLGLPGDNLVVDSTSSSGAQTS